MKSSKLERFIENYYRPSKGGDSAACNEYSALLALLGFLESYPGENSSLVLTKSRLHSIFYEYFSGFEEVEFFISKLSYKHPHLLIPRYFFEDDRDKPVPLTAADVFKYISRRSNIDPISGEPSDAIADFIFVEYLLNKEAVDNE